MQYNTPHLASGNDDDDDNNEENDGVLVEEGKNPIITGFGGEPIQGVEPIPPSFLEMQQQQVNDDNPVGDGIVEQQRNNQNITGNNTNDTNQMFNVNLPMSLVQSALTEKLQSTMSQQNLIQSNDNQNMSPRSIDNILNVTHEKKSYVDR